MTTTPRPEATNPGQGTDQAPRTEAQEPPGREPGRELGPEPGPAPGPAPGSPSEKYLAALWSEIIGLDRVLLPHKFLDVGGNSLTLNIILNRVEAETGVSLDAQLFYDDERSSLFEIARELDVLRDQQPGRVR